MEQGAAALRFRDYSPRDVFRYVASPALLGIERGHSNRPVELVGKDHANDIGFARALLVYLPPSAAELAEIVHGEIDEPSACAGLVRDEAKARCHSELRTLQTDISRMKI